MATAKAARCVSATSPLHINDFFSQVLIRRGGLWSSGAGASHSEQRVARVPREPRRDDPFWLIRAARLGRPSPWRRQGWAGLIKHARAILSRVLWQLSKRQSATGDISRPPDCLGYDLNLICAYWPINALHKWWQHCLKSGQENSP